MYNTFLVHVSWVKSRAVHKKVRLIQNSEAAPPCDTLSGRNRGVLGRASLCHCDVLA